MSLLISLVERARDMAEGTCVLPGTTLCSQVLPTTVSDLRGVV